MPRDLILDFRQGGGSVPEVAHAVVRIWGTEIRPNATSLVLTTETTLKLTGGKATLLNAQTSGTGPLYEWAYIIQVEPFHGRNFRFYVAIPDGTGLVNLKDLPKLDPVTGEGIYVDFTEWEALYADIPDRMDALEGKDASQDAIIEAANTKSQSVVDRANAGEFDGVQGIPGKDGEDGLKLFTVIQKSDQGAEGDSAFIQNAVNAAIDAGKTRIVVQGEYNLDTPVTVSSDATFEAIGEARFNVVNNIAFQVGADVSASFDNLDFYGTVISGVPATSLNEYGVRADLSKNVSVTNSRFHRMGRAGVWLNDVDDWTVENNLFEEYGYCATTANSGVGGRFANNTLVGTGIYPEGYLYCYGFTASHGGAAPRPAVITVEGNHVENQAWEALDTHGGMQMIFKDNIINNCERGIVATQVIGIADSVPYDVILKGNIIDAKGRVGVGNGIAVSGNSAGSPTAEAILTDNIVTGYGSQSVAAGSYDTGAIVLQAVRNATLSGNKVKDAYGCGFRIRYVNSVTSIGNIIDRIIPQTNTVEHPARGFHLQVSGVTLGIGNTITSDAEFIAVMGTEGSPQWKNGGGNRFQGKRFIGVTGNRDTALASTATISEWPPGHTTTIVNSGQGYPEPGMVNTYNNGNDRSAQHLIGTTTGRSYIRVGDVEPNYGKWAAFRAIEGV